MLERDVDNLADYFGRFAPELLATEYAKKFGSLRERRSESRIVLTGQFRAAINGRCCSIMREINDAAMMRYAVVRT